MNRRGFGKSWIGAALLAVVSTSTARAQALAVSIVPGSESAHAFYAAPGNYGTSLGTASYGSVRTYSSFSSPYGGGYGYGYAPSTFIDGPYGMGIWRPQFPQAPLWNAAAHSYRTFPVPYTAGTTAPTPSFGYYAPAFGPPSPNTR